MKFQVNKDVLSEAVGFAVRLLPQRPNIAILGGILIEADANALRLSVFDYEVSAQIEVVAKVDEPGRILVSGRLLADIANRLPNAPVEFSSEANKMIVQCGSSKFQLITMSVDSYPTLPEIPVASGTIPADAFAEAISQVAVASAKEDTTQVYSTVELEADAKTITFLATDRFRIALREVDWKGPAESSVALVPARTLIDVAKTFSNLGDISISIAKRNEREMIAFKASNRSVTAQLFKGTIPPVKNLIPTEVPNFAVVSTQELIDSTRRVSLVLERDNPIKYSFEDGQVTLEASGNETAQASESVNIELTGNPIVVSLKPQFLIDGLSGVHSEFVRISFTNNDNPNKPGPVLITAQGTKEKPADSYRYLLQPNLLSR